MSGQVDEPDSTLSLGYPGAMGFNAQVMSLKMNSALRCLQPNVAFDNPFGDRVSGQPSDIMNPEFIHDLLPMLFHRLNTDAQLRSYLLVRPSLGDELQHFRFASRQVVGSALCWL